MNPPLRKLTAVVVVMFLTLMVAVTNIQFFQAKSLNADSRNVRTLYHEYGKERGPIIVAGKPIVTSQPSNGVYAFQRAYQSPELWAQVTGYFSTAFNAMTGLERYENAVLGGTDSSLSLQRVKQLFTGEEPRGGAVSLTLNPAAQAAAWNGLGANRGAVVALEPATGRILALVSKPSFDPNLIASADNNTAQQAWDKYSNDPAKPMLNRALGGETYPPGSVFKIITAAAMLESGMTPETGIEAPTAYTPPGTNHPIYNSGKVRCGNGSGNVPLRTAFAESCNTAFAIAGVNMGSPALVEMAEKFGFGQEVETPLPVRPSQITPTTVPAEVAFDAFGQRDVRISPLQLAMMGAAVANRGVIMQPYLVEQTLTADLAVIDTTHPTEFANPISAQSAQDLESMMIDVVSRGSGRSAAINGVTVAGKTGTAETGNDKLPHAWFVGYDVGSEPRVVVAVFVENGGYGGKTAAPIARDVIRAVLGK